MINLKILIDFLEELDPHSKYISNDELEVVNEQMQGQFEGIGIEYSMLDGYITVISPIPGTPSDRAGIQSGDKIIEIDGKSAYKKEGNNTIFNIFDRSHQKESVSTNLFSNKNL